MPDREPLWRRYLRFFGADPKADVDDEIGFHLQELERQFVASGMQAADAREAARLQFGDTARVRRALHHRRTVHMRRRSLIDWLESVSHDLRLAARQLRGQPAFALTVIAVLALGTGATTAMFTAVDATMLRPLPFANPDRLVVASNVLMLIRSGPPNPAAPLDAGDIADMHDLFSSVATYMVAPAGLDLNDPLRPERLNVSIVTWRFFETLGVHAAHGRTFTAAEGARATAPVAMLSDDCWRRDFGGTPMVGRTVTLNRQPYTVVGVLPPGFAFPHRSDIWIPMSMPPSVHVFDAVQGQVLSSMTIGRLRDGVSLQSAQLRMAAAWHARAGSRAARWVPTRPLFPLQDVLGLGDRQPMLILLGATALLLLLACVNVANLQLSRGATRSREIAVRAALGGTRGRIVRQLFAESILLAAAGAVLGLALAPASFGLVRQLLPASLVDVSPARIDARVLAFATLLVAFTAVISGLWPAYRAARVDPHGALKSGSTGATGRATSRRVRRLLAVSELALAAMLMIGAGLMLRSLARLMSVDTGFRPEHVATMNVTAVPKSANATYDARQVGERALVDALIHELSGMPGISAVGAVDVLPMTFGGLRIGLTAGAGEVTPYDAAIVQADSGYLRAAGIGLVRGRWFTALDDSVKPGAIVLSQTTADSLWPGQDPIGRTVDAGREGKRVVIGVVDDVRQFALTEPASQAYVPLHDDVPQTVSLVVRGSLPGAQLLATLRAAMRRVAPTLPPYDVRTFESLFREHLASSRAVTTLITLFGILALLLASVGVYAVMAYGVAGRAREFGIRAALGADYLALLREVAREAALLSLTGVLVGLAAAWGATRLLSSQLYGVAATDGTTYAAAVLILLAAAAAAALVPARRAAATDVLAALREE